MPRVKTAGYNPVTNQYHDKTSQLAARKMSVPTLAKVRAAFGKTVQQGRPYAWESPVAISVENQFFTKTALVSQISFSNPRDADLYIQADASGIGVPTYDAATKAVFVAIPGSKAVIAYVAHKGMLVKVTAQDKAKAIRLIGMLR